MPSNVSRYYKHLIFPIIIIVFLFNNKLQAQIELFGFAGYLVASDVQVSEGDLNVYSNPNFGAGLAFELDRGIQVELFWIGQQTTMDLKRNTGITEPLFDIGIHYFQTGIVYEFRKRRKQEAFPFISFSLGTTLFTPESTTYSDEWRFSVTFGGGGKFYLSDNIGLRLQARLLLPLNFSSVGMWCGPGGCSVGVGSWATFLQANFTAGVFLRLGK